ncbi:MAG: hypothetical protein K2W96_24145, partial [Gemmataceae bacterium]|nr:hypothetical protein [Gemmataceae bacterium]
MARRAVLSLESLEDRSVPAASLSAWLGNDGVLLIQGTENADTIVVRQDAIGRVSVQGISISVLGGANPSVAASSISRIEVQGLGGDDLIRTDSENISGFVGLTRPVTIFAGAGNDTIRAGNRGTTIHGQTGNDSIFGGAGNDTIFGGAGNDTIVGGAGND